MVQVFGIKIFKWYWLLFSVIVVITTQIMNLEVQFVIFALCCFLIYLGYAILDELNQLKKGKRK